MAKKSNLVSSVMLVAIVWSTTSCMNQQYVSPLIDKKNNKQLTGAEQDKYYRPAPPVGRWSAIYTANFAKKFNLPASGISDELDNSIEYMETVSIPAKKLDKFNERYPDQDCVINFLANKYHDIPLHETPSISKAYTAAERVQHQQAILADRMKRLNAPLQFLEAGDKYKASYRSISAFNAIHSADLVPGYGYFSKYDLRCRLLLGSRAADRDAEFDRFVRASVIEKKVKKAIHTHSGVEYREVIVQKNEEDSFLTISVPKILAANLYNGVEIPRRPFPVSPAQAPLAIAALPFIVAAASTAPADSKEPHRIALPPVWPEGVSTHFKLTGE